MAPSRSAFRRANFKLLDDIKDETAAIRCVADLVEFNAIHNPEHVFCIQSRQRLSGKEFEFVCITYHELAGAVERCCEWILSNIPGAHAAVPAKTGIARKSKPVALYLESDVGLFIHLVALLALNIPVRVHVRSLCIALTAVSRVVLITLHTTQRRRRPSSA